jgi:hypothetical protein
MGRRDQEFCCAIGFGQFRGNALFQEHGGTLMIVWKALIMMFGFWFVLAAVFFVMDGLLQRLKVRLAQQEKIQAFVFITIFFLWWGLFYLWFVH